MPKKLPSVEKLLSLFDYNRETGKLYWKKDKTPAGSISARGRISIRIDNCDYYAHRIIWKIEHNSEPHEIDHIDGDCGNNRIKNLRTCSRSQNCGNTRKHKNNTSGYKGVTFHSQTGKWRAKICVEGNHISLGLYDSAAAAHSAYAGAAFKIFKEFARVN